MPQRVMAGAKIVERNAAPAARLLPVPPRTSAARLVPGGKLEFNGLREPQVQVRRFRLKAGATMVKPEYVIRGKAKRHC
jgi:hypothetical protein